MHKQPYILPQCSDNMIIEQHFVISYNLFRMVD